MILPTTDQQMCALTTFVAAVFSLMACTGPAAPQDAPVGYNEKPAFISAGTGAVAVGGAAQGDAVAASGPETPADGAALASNSAIAPKAQVSQVSGTAPQADSAASSTGSGSASAAMAGAGVATPSGASSGSAAASSPATPATSSATMSTTPSAESAAPGDVTAQSALPKASKLTVGFTTKSYGGMYQPVNLGAVWIEDEAGKWVYTLEMWCGWQNTRSLVPYDMSGGVDYSVGLFPGTYTTMPPSDVVTSATLRQHKTHTGAAWSLKDSKGNEVPDGMYKLMLEMTEEQNAGKVLEVPFMKGAPAGPVSAPDSPVFTNLKIELK